MLMNSPDSEFRRISPQKRAYRHQLQNRRPSGSHRERVLSRISPAQSVYRMMEVTSGKKPVAPEILGTTSVHLRSGNFDGFLCKRHQQKHLVFFPTCFASRVSGVRIPSRPPNIKFVSAKYDRSIP